MFPPWETKEVLLSKCNSQLQHTNTHVNTQTYKPSDEAVEEILHIEIVQHQVEVSPPSTRAIVAVVR